MVVSRLDEHFQQRFLRVQTVLGLIPGHRTWVVEQVEADFLAAVGRQAVHKQHVAGGQVEQFAGHLVGREQLEALGGFFFLTHGGPHVGAHQVGAGHGFARVADDLYTLTGQGQEAGDALVRHPGVDHIHFAGSATVGTLIQQTAAERHCLVTLELSGKSPQIVFADADLDTALPAIVHAIVHNAGQSGSAGSRVLIDALLYEPLLERIGRAFEQLRVGPAAMDLDLGPLIHARQQQRVWDFLSDAQVAGIPMVAQGQIVDEAPETGFFQVPTLLRDVPAAHRLAQDDIGGPVLCAMPFEDEDHAIELAHATRCLPAAGVWTCDGERQLRMARRLRSGQVFINHSGAGRGVELPFDENQSSGDGRNAGMETLYGFTRRKTVAVRHG